MVAKAAKLIDRVPTDDEDKFREKMRTCGNAIGTAQSHIREALARTKKADPGIDDEQAATEAVAGEDPGQTLRASFSAGTRMDDLCYYYTCLYVGLTLFHSAAIRNDTESGKLEQEKLKQVLQAMRDTPQPPRILPDSVRAMCTFLDVPDLEASYPSEPGPVQKASLVTKETQGDAEKSAVTVQPPKTKRRRR